jgi:hypothetical protein
MNTEVFFDAEKFAVQIAEISKQLMDADRIFSAAREQDVDIEELCESLSTLNFLKQELASVYDTAAKIVADKMGSLPIVSLSNGTTIEKKSGSDRKSWDHDALASIVTRRLVEMSTDLDTGEMKSSIDDIASQLLRFVQPSYWRIKELSKIGVNADNYCQVSDEVKTSIIIRKAK